jgi:hypothetical protein
METGFEGAAPEILIARSHQPPGDSGITFIHTLAFSQEGRPLVTTLKPAMALGLVFKLVRVTTFDIYWRSYWE